MIIREATTADAESLAHVHVQCWRETYGDILPAAYLIDMSWQQRTEKWRKGLLEAKAPWKLYVAEEGGAIKGFAASGVSEKSDFDIKGELYVLYLLKEAQGQGLGRQLFEKGRHNLIVNGIKDMYLWVFKDNPALAFYQHMGGKECARQTVTIGGRDVEEIALQWGV